jgi:hypothetical protein
VVLHRLPTGILRFEEFETTPDEGCPMNARAQQALPQGTPGFLDRGMTRYSHDAEQLFQSWSARENLLASALPPWIRGIGAASAVW